MNKPLHYLGLLTLCVLPIACGNDETPDQQLDPQVAALKQAADDRLAIDIVYERDERIRLLMQSVDVSKGHYTRDTGDPLAILMDKLVFSAAEVLHRAKEDLANMGSLAIPAITQMLDRNFDDQGGSARVQNSIEVLGMMDTPAAHDGLVRCLDHPRDTVRGAALRALSKGSALPADFDRLLVHVATEREHMRESAATALTVADPTRAATQLMDWIEADQNQDLWDLLGNQFHLADPAVVGERAGQLCMQVYPTLGLSLAAIAEPVGSQSAHALMAQYLESDSGSQRANAIAAMLQAGRVQELTDLIVEDPDPFVRSLVVGQLSEDVKAGRRELTKDETNLVFAALDDQDNDVRQLALGILLRLDDPRGIDRALGQLGQDRFAMQATITVLAPVMRDKPELARRALERLIEVDQAVSHRPLSERLATFQGIGQVPLADASEFLWSLAQTAEGELQGMRAHRWLTVQAANTGDLGRLALGAHLAEETDFSRRLDLIWGASSQRSEESRAFLIEFVESDPDPYEALFAAERLARNGPVQIVAPVLKRVSLRITHARVRAAFDALLWRWF